MKRVVLALGTVVLLSSVVGLGCGGGSTKKPIDAGADAKDGSAMVDAAMEKELPTGDAPRSDASAGDVATPDATEIGDAPSELPTEDASDAGASDAPAQDAADAGSGDAADASFSATIAVVAAQNAIDLDTCGVTPATFSNVPTGTYTMTLTASTLSKGGVSGPTPPPPSFDNYIIVHVPLPPGDPHEDHRFFMLNDVGASASVTLPGTETIQMMFIDSDLADNTGTGSVSLAPGGSTATVDAVANAVAYTTGCNSTPAMLALPDGTFRATLIDSTLSSGAGAHDDFVLLRVPSEQPTDPHRYVILNGVGASQVFTPYNSQTVRAWYIGASAGTGQAHVQITSL